MSDIVEFASQLTAWLQPLPDPSAPCGPDLEYDNDFLALTQAATGKPESQFGPAEPPDWRQAAKVAEELFERTRDLRVALVWTRAQLHLHGYAALGPGLQLLTGLMEQHWEHLHPLPDPDDGDPYGRVNALAELSAPAGALADIRDARVVDARAIGQLRAGDIETALGLAPLGKGRDEVSAEQARRMLSLACEKEPALRAVCIEARTQCRRLVACTAERLDTSQVPDLRPLSKLVDGVASLLPPAAVAESATGQAGADGEPSATAAASRGLSGSVNSRAEAVQAIDMVIAYLEQAEPTNPAPLFLRRARQLLTHNFLQLMKVLAPDALADVAKMVGVDPDSVDEPGSGA